MSFCVIDRENNMTPIKSGFHTAAQANNWAKKNLPKGEVKLLRPGFKPDYSKYYRYLVLGR